MPQSPQNWKDNLEVAARTSVGMRRSNNQDSHAVVLAGDYEHWVERGHVFVVADGMGAHAAGELASKLAADNIPHTYHKMPDQPPPAAIERSILAANNLIHGRGQADAAFHGMGTTCSTLVLLPAGALVAHVGDSRVYRLRQGILEQLTFDHSLVWEMIATGQVKNEEVAGFVPKNVITRSLGPNAQVKVDLEGPFPIEIGDTFLLCSDGLTGPVRDEEIAVILGSMPLADAVQTLIDLANLRGGPDNITAVTVRVNGPLDGQANAKQKTDGAPIHPALLISAAVLFMAALGMLVLGQHLAAGVSVLGALLAGGAALMQHYNGGGEATKNTAIGGRYGKGPHRRYDGRPNPQITENFSEVVRRLTDAARRDSLPIDWQQLDRCNQAAALSLADANYTAAIAHYCQAIRQVTSELHKVRGR